LAASPATKANEAALRTHLVDPHQTGAGAREIRTTLRPTLSECPLQRWRRSGRPSTPCTAECAPSHRRDEW